jgi:glycosyltransferase involved in cell wall biosynthesis
MSSVVIPVYNERDLIEPVVRRVLSAGAGKEVVVVDDGSTDGTGEVLARLAKELPIRVARHARNRGKGAAIRTGIEASSGDIVLIQDADLEYDPSDYPVLIAPILDGKAEVVMGSRFLRQKPHFFTTHGDPFFSHYIGNRLIIWLTNCLYGFRASDYEACYKVFTRAAYEASPVMADGFEFDNELICKFLRQGRRIVEVPVRYTPRTYREGKKITWPDGVRMLWTIIKWRVIPLNHARPTQVP